jgi:hypothetical protein
VVAQRNAQQHKVTGHRAGEYMAEAKAIAAPLRTWMGVSGRQAVSRRLSNDDKLSGRISPYTSSRT